MLALPAKAPVPHRQRGFTLIEVVVAFALLAIGLGAVMQIAVGAMHQTRQAADFTEAALYAQSLLDNVGVGYRLEEGGDSGTFGERYSWQLDVTPFEMSADFPLEPEAVPVVLYRLDLQVSWNRGRNTHEAHFSTLRALLPE